jgi:hypothetical protein
MTRRPLLAWSGYSAIKTLEETFVAAVLVEYKHEGMEVEAVACHIMQGLPWRKMFTLAHDCPESAGVPIDGIAGRMQKMGVAIIAA